MPILYRCVRRRRSPSSLPVRMVALLMIGLLLPWNSLQAQTSSSIGQINPPLMLHITILEGDNALNNIRQRTAREPIVQVEDSNHKPVAGVAILFSSVRGQGGAGGSFDSFPSYKTVTDAQGRAVGRGFQPNNVAGQFTINVQATFAGMAAAVVIHEQNTVGGGGGGGNSTEINGASKAGTGTAGSGSHVLHVINLIPKWVIVGVVVSGAAAGAVVATRGSSGAVISSGGGTVTAPAAGQATGRR